MLAATAVVWAGLFAFLSPASAAALMICDWTEATSLTCTGSGDWSDGPPAYGVYLSIYDGDGTGCYLEGGTLLGPWSTDGANNIEHPSGGDWSRTMTAQYWDYGIPDGVALDTGHTYYVEAMNDVNVACVPISFGSAPPTNEPSDATSDAAAPTWAGVATSAAGFTLICLIAMIGAAAIASGGKD